MRDVFWTFQIENLKKERVYGLETKARLSRIFEDSEIFLNTLKKARKSDYEVSSIYNVVVCISCVLTTCHPLHLKYEKKHRSYQKHYLICV